MKTSFCPYCKLKTDLYVTTKDFNRKTDYRDFYYYKCKKCKLIYLDDIPVDLDKFYPPQYYFLPNNEESLLKTYNNEAYKIEIVKNYLTSGSLLEVGPSFGTFCALAKENGFITEAIEMSSECCNFIRKNLNINVYQSDDPASVLRSSYKAYDIVVMWQVIEHIINPFELLEEIVKKIKKNGFLILSTPNPDSFQFKLFGKKWTHLDAPRHIYLFTPEVLINNLKSRGMKLIHITYTDKGSLGWNIFGWAVSFREFFSIKIYRYLAFNFGRVFARIIKPYEKLNNNGSSFTIIFRKNI